MFTKFLPGSLSINPNTETSLVKYAVLYAHISVLYVRMYSKSDCALTFFDLSQIRIQYVPTCVYTYVCCV